MNTNLLATPREEAIKDFIKSGNKEFTLNDIIDLLHEHRKHIPSHAARSIASTLRNMIRKLDSESAPGRIKRTSRLGRGNSAIYEATGNWSKM